VSDSPSSRRAGLALAAAAGALGLLSGARGSLDPSALLAWLVLAAPAVGALCGGITRTASVLVVPLSWSALLLWASARSSGRLATPGWAACAVGGLFLAGVAVAWRTRWAPSAAAGLAVLTLALSGAALGFGFVPVGAELAPSHPAFAARLLDLSPLVLAFDCAGQDWVHAQPDLYVQAGIEWLPRHPYRGSLAGPLVLVVGCALSGLARSVKSAR
jgi:hypothetical protein